MTNTPTETLVAELRVGATHFEALSRHLTADLMTRAAEALTTQSALIETLTRERDEARQSVLDTQAVAEDYLKRAEAAEAKLAGAYEVLQASQTASVVEDAAALIKDAFDLGFAWKGQLVGQNIEDSRAVVRTLNSECFGNLKVDVSGIDGFTDAFVGICAAKAAIKKALVARLQAARMPAPVAEFRVEVHTMKESHQTTYWVALIRSDCPKDKFAPSAADGYIAPSKFLNRDHAYIEAADWAAFLGVASPRATGETGNG